MSTRLLFIIPTLDRNGAEKQLTLLASGLPRAEFDVRVCCLTRGGPLEDNLRAAGVPVTIIGKRWKLDPAAYGRLLAHIRDVAPEIVHTWLFAANSYGRLAAQRAGVPTIIAGERCVDPWKRWHELAIDRWLTRYTRRVVTNSSGVRDFYVRQGISAKLFSVIPNGINVPAFLDPPRLAEQRQELLRELHLPANARLIGTVGRLWPQKRQRDLIWAADLLKCVHDDTYLLIVGDGPLRWRLERYTRQIQITDRVLFLGERQDVPRLMPHFSCFWLGSEYEGQSNALMEAMSWGIPCVATDIPGNRDLVVPEQTGYLVPVGDRAELARKTERLLENPDWAAQLGAAGRARMAREFSVEQMVARHAELYRSLRAG
jgi:glycosyltransferase involved in cell wall biosynthesis